MIAVAAAAVILAEIPMDWVLGLVENKHTDRSEYMAYPASNSSYLL
jgi:hypothetical protein